MATITYTGALVTTSCWCGIQLAVPEELYEHAKKRPSNHIYCPLGHTFVYSNTLEEQLKQARDEAAEARRRARANRDLLEAEERSHSATRGHLTRAKKRIGNGVCPCCKRHFANVERHMSTQHPDYKEG